MEISITSDMFNYHFKPTMDRKLKLFADYGFRFIHWCEDWNSDTLYAQEDMTTYGHQVASAGLKCVDVHGTATESIRMDSADEAALRSYVKLLANRIEFCKFLGGDSVVVHPPRFEAPELERRVEQSITVLDSVRPMCEDTGITIAVENCHGSDDKIIETYFEAYPSEFLGFCFDSGHANINRDTENLFRFRSRLRALHLHDNNGQKDDHQPPYSGTVEWDRVMSWIRSCRYVKPINFEITHEPSLFKGTMEEFLDHATVSISRVMNLMENT